MQHLFPRPFTLKIAVVAIFGGFLFGYDYGVISQALPLIAAQFKLTIEQEELVSSLVLIGQIPGSIIGGYICDTIGRKRTIYVVCLIFILGSCILTFATNLVMLYVGRFIIGIGIAISIIVDVAYLTETSPNLHRGALVSGNDLMMTIGMLFANTTGYIFSSSSNGWRQMFALPIFISLIWAALMCFLPESPKWLLVQGDEEKALTVYRARVDTEQEAQEDFRSACDQVAREKEVDKVTLLEIVQFWRYSFIVSFWILLAQGLSGNLSVLTYAPAVFKAAGYGKQAAGQATIILSAIKVFFTFISMSSVDILGRKNVLMTGILGIIIALIGIIASIDNFVITSEGGSGPTSSGVATSVFVCLLVASFSIGYGPLSWVISSELFPDDIRGRALGVVSIANAVGAYIAVASFLSMVTALGPKLAFSVYLIITGVTFIFLLQCLPETYLRSAIDLHAELAERFKFVPYWQYHTPVDPTDNIKTSSKQNSIYQLPPDDDYSIEIV